jgi:hypothetical protein
LTIITQSINTCLDKSSYVRKLRMVKTVKALPNIKLFGEHFVTLAIEKLCISGNNHYTIYIRLNGQKAIPYLNNTGLTYAFKTYEEAFSYALELSEVRLEYVLLSVIKAKNLISCDKSYYELEQFFKWFQYELMYELDLIHTIQWPVTPGKTRIKIQAHPKFNSCKMGSLNYLFEFSVHGDAHYRSIDCSIPNEFMTTFVDFNMPIANIVHSFDTQLMYDIFKFNIASLDALGPSISKNLQAKKSGMLRFQAYLSQCN